MKAIFAAGASLMILCAVWVTAGNAQIYDESYAGPRNYNGHPTFQPYQLQGRQAQQSQSVDNGLIFQAARGMYQVGNFLWGYMPAPVRGVGSPYNLAPDSGPVSVNFVPGR